MRIVFLSPSGELGGAETALLEMLAAVRHARPDWTLAVIASSDGPLVVKAATYADASALRFPEPLAKLGEWGARGSIATRLRLAGGLLAAAAPVLSYTRSLRQRLLDFRPDIIHSNGLKMHLLGARARPAGTKVLWHLHDYPSARRLTARLLASQARRCAAMLANSESVAADIRNVFRSSVPVHTVYNSIDLERFNPSGPRVDLDTLAGMPPLADGGIRVGLIATFARWKGHEIFLAALARLRNQVNIRGYIVGDPIYHTDASQYSRAELRTRAQALGLAGTVGFTGKVDDVSAVMRSLDIVVHASTEPEPFGLVIAEAMACGRPVVVSRAGGAAEIAQAGAVFHEPGNSEALAECLGQLAGDAAQRAALGSAGRDVAVRLFSRSRLSAHLVPVYEALGRTSSHV